MGSAPYTSRAVATVPDWAMETYQRAARVRNDVILEEALQVRSRAQYYRAREEAEAAELQRMRETYDLPPAPDLNLSEFGDPACDTSSSTSRPEDPSP